MADKTYDYDVCKKVDSVVFEHKLYPIGERFNVLDLLIDAGVKRPVNGDTNKISYYDNERDTRYRLKTGKFLKKMFCLTDDDERSLESVICHATEKLNSILFPIIASVEIVRGQDVADSYWDGFANNCDCSCMCGDYNDQSDTSMGIVNLYSENPDKVGLVHLKSENGGISRSLYWTLDCGKTFLDRVYGCDTGARMALENWGKKNADMYKEGCSGQVRSSLEGDNLSIDDLLEVTLKVAKNNKFPYMDTLSNMVFVGDGKITVSSRPKRHSLSMKNTDGGYEGDNRSRECCCCEERYDSDDMQEINGEMYCCGCAEDYSECDCCGDMVHYENSVYVGVTCEDVCEYCFSQNYSTCAHCDEFVPNNDTEYVLDVGNVCDGCINKHYTKCQVCDEYVDDCNAQRIESTNEDVCDDCLSRHYDTCEECDEYFPGDDLNSDGLCDDCCEKKENSKELELTESEN